MSQPRQHTLQGIRHDVETTLLHATYNRGPLNILLTVVATTIFAPLIWRFFPSKWMTLWVAALFGDAVLNYGIWLVFRKKKPGKEALSSWRKLLIVQCALAGASWTIGPTMMMPQATGMQAALLVAMLFCVCSVVVISMSEQRMAMQVYVIAVMAPVAMATWFAGDEVGRVISLGLFFGMTVLILVGRNSNQATRRELELVEQQARADENRQLSHQIAHLDRQRSMGEMASALAHEINQPLTAILSNAQVVQRGLETAGLDPEKHAHFNAKIIYNSQRAAEVVQRIRGFIRPGVMRHEPVNLIQVVHEVASLVEDDMRRHKVDLVFAEHANSVPVLGDAVQLSQIVLNIFRNAIDALEQSSLREIRVTCNVAEGYAVLSIQDTGSGLGPEALTQAGTPFFTTKSSGLGVGISISRTIANQHGGSLTLSNVGGGQGSGALIELKLPTHSTVQLLV